jgi:hypothetical protein
LCIVKRGRGLLLAAGFALGSGAFLLTQGGTNSVLAQTILESAGLEPPDRQLAYAQERDHLDWVRYSRQIRATNAVATLAFGLMGSLVGLMAFRPSVQNND